MTVGLKIFLECAGTSASCEAGAGETAPLVRFCADRRLEICLLPGSSAVQMCLVPDGDDGMRTVSVPQAQNPDCDLCGSCTRNIMLCRAGDEDVIVYVGERSSGSCPAAYADVVFARKALQKECQMENISYLPYRTLDDVRASLGRLGTGLRKRRRAEARRREAFCTE